MNTQILPVSQVVQNSVRNTSDAGLESAAVLDEIGNMPGNGALHLRRRIGSDFWQWVIHFDNMIEFADMDEAIAQRARHPRMIPTSIPKEQ